MNINLDFNSMPGGGEDVLQDFDFDSFLAPDAQDPNGFNFDVGAFSFGGETLEAGTGE